MVLLNVCLKCILFKKNFSVYCIVQKSHVSCHRFILPVTVGTHLHSPVKCVLCVVGGNTWSTCPSVKRPGQGSNPRICTLKSHQSNQRASTTHKDIFFMFLNYFESSRSVANSLCDQFIRSLIACFYFFFFCRALYPSSNLERGWPQHVWVDVLVGLLGTRWRWYKTVSWPILIDHFR